MVKKSCAVTRNRSTSSLHIIVIFISVFISVNISWLRTVNSDKLTSDVTKPSHWRLLPKDVKHLKRNRQHINSNMRIYVRITSHNRLIIWARLCLGYICDRPTNQNRESNITVIEIISRYWRHAAFCKRGRVLKHLHIQLLSCWSSD